MINIHNHIVILNSSTVILNSFQDLVCRSKNPDVRHDHEIPDQVRNDIGKQDVS